MPAAENAETPSESIEPPSRPPDAAEHLIHNPNPAWQQSLDNATREGERMRLTLPPAVQERTAELWNRQMVVTLIVLVISTAGGLVFFRGYTRGFVRLAVVTVVV